MDKHVTPLCCLHTTSRTVSEPATPPPPLRPAQMERNGSRDAGGAQRNRGYGCWVHGTSKHCYWIRSRKTTIFLSRAHLVAAAVKDIQIGQSRSQRGWGGSCFGCPQEALQSSPCSRAPPCSMLEGRNHTDEANGLRDPQYPGCPAPRQPDPLHPGNSHTNLLGAHVQTAALWRHASMLS